MIRALPFLPIALALILGVRPGSAIAESSDAPLVTLSLSSGEVELGQPFFLYIEASTRDGVEVSLPRELQLGPAFEELGRKLSVTRPGERMLHTFELRVMAFELGDLEIPEIPILYGGTGGAREVRTASSRVMVRSLVPLDRQELRDVAPTAVVRRDLSRVYWVGGAFAAFVLLTTVVLVISRRSPRTKEVASVPAVEPLERFRSRAEAVEAALADEAGTSRPHYVEMSEAMREYLGNAFEISAMDATTSEIAESTQPLAALDESRDDLIVWLQDCDLVKFAGYRAGRDEGRQALAQARRWVERVDRARRREERRASG